MNKDRIKDFFNGIAPERDAWRKRNSYYHDDIKGFLRFLIPAGCSVLDVGCATGETTSWLAKDNPDIRGIDFSPAMIAEGLRKYPGLDLKVEDAETLPLGERSYDYIVISDLVGYLDDVQIFLSSLRERSHPKTKLVITTYNYLWEPLLVLAERLKLKMPNPMQNWLSDSDIENLLYLAWGIKVNNVELKDVSLPESMERTIAKQAEAEREKRAVIINSEGELAAASNVAKAAEILSVAPGALHLRTLQAINDISSDQSNTVLFVTPAEILRAFDGFTKKINKE